MPKAKTKPNYPEIEDIKEDLNSLKTNVVELTKTIKSDGSDQAMEIKDVAMNRIEGLKMQGQQQVKNIERRVKAKPAQSIAMAFVAGLALSALIRRR